MGIVSRLGVVLGLDSAEFNAGLSKAEGKLTGFSNLAKGIGAAAVATLGYEFAQAAVKAINFADKINDVAKANEVTVGTVLKLSQALTLNGGESESAGRMFSTFTNKIDDAAEGGEKAQKSFAKLGISLDDLSKMSQQELFDKALKALSDPSLGDVVTRNALAMDIFGKAVKGVDIKGLSQDYESNQKNFKDAERAFQDIGKAMDTWDKLTQQVSASLATNLAPALTTSVGMLDTFINGWDRLEKNIDKANKARVKFENQGVEWKPTVGYVGQEMTAGEIEALRKITNANARNVTPADQKEKDAAAKKLTDEYERQKTSLYQQSLELERQLKFVGQQQTGAEKLALEFEKGGKYARLKGTADEKALMNQQRQLDLANQQYDRAKELTQQVIKRYEIYKQGEDALKEVIERRQQEAEAFDLRVRDIEILTERLNYERQLASLSDTQRQKALEFFDLRQKIVRMTETELGLSTEQIARQQEAEQGRIIAQEQNERAQNTFGAGWDRAYNNFVEKAKDSSSAGAQAFNSMTSNMESALDRFVQTGKISFSELANSIIQDLLRIAMRAQITGLFENLLGGMGGIGGLFGGSSGGVGANAGAYSIGDNPFIGMYADGGNPPVGMPSIVGERGPELFIPKTSGTIIPNNALSGVMGNQPQVVYNGPYIQNLSAIDTQSATQFLSQNKQAVWSANQSAQRSLPMSR
jgi:lambda family phage tail tape measure protein